MAIISDDTRSLYCQMTVARAAHDNYSDDRDDLNQFLSTAYGRFSKEVSKINTILTRGDNPGAHFSEKTRAFQFFTYAAVPLLIPVCFILVTLMYEGQKNPVWGLLPLVVGFAATVLFYFLDMAEQAYRNAYLRSTAVNRRFLEECANLGYQLRSSLEADIEAAGYTIRGIDEENYTYLTDRGVLMLMTDSNDDIFLTENGHPILSIYASLLKTAEPTETHQEP